MSDSPDHDSLSDDSFSDWFSDEPTSLRPVDPHDASTRAFRALLLRERVISLPRLLLADAECRRTGEPLARVLTHSRLLDETQVRACLARASSVPLAVAPLAIADEMIDRPGGIPLDACRRHSVIPLAGSQPGMLHVAMTDPTDDELAADLESHTGCAVSRIVAGEQDIRDALRALVREKEIALSTDGLYEQSPRQSARHVLSRGQAVIMCVLLAVTLLLLVLRPVATIMLMSTTMMVIYALISAVRLATVLASIRTGPTIEVADRDIDALGDALPSYTILVPLFRETEVLPRLIDGLARLDYPPALLDVKLLLEESDIETVAAARALDLPSYVDVVVTPDAHPRTKPKSCNYGLLYARGEFVVIYDAEDVPEPDQLRRVVAGFRQVDDDVVCMQAHLNYYNRDQNLLTRWFTGEYSGWFDLYMPGLDALRLPFPLGGTSNHFRTDVLVSVGAWDPYNVTEDADLGMRLAARGYSSRIIHSTTYEEANSETFNWIRQRSRWVKGYAQTWLVHMRSPRAFMRAVGWRNFAGFNLVIGGTVYVFLMNPVQWIVLGVWALTQAHVVRELYPSWVFYLAWTSFVLGNFTFMYVNVLAVMRRAYWDIVAAALVSPLYWGLMSIAAWRGIIQLVTNPSYWEKTEHGLDVRSDADGDRLEHTDHDGSAHPAAAA